MNVRVDANPTLVEKILSSVFPEMGDEELQKTTQEAISFLRSNGQRDRSLTKGMYSQAHRNTTGIVDELLAQRSKLLRDLL